MLSNELKLKIDSLWKKFWANGMPEHIDALEHMSYLIFMKKLEDYENSRIQNAKSLGNSYKSIFDGKKEMRWSIWKNYEGGKMLEHVRTEVFPFIKNLGEEGSQLQLQMEDASFEMKSPVLLQESIGVIDDLKISQQNQDVQGDMYEYMTSKLKTAGLNGQFRTPRHIIRLMVELVDPDINQTICDPACGTGGFLVNAYQHILKKYTSKDLLEYDIEGVPYNLRGDLLPEQSRDFLMKDAFYGFDFSNTMIRIGLMNMILHGFSKPNIHFSNSLGKEFGQNEEYNIILANPPFSGNLNKNEINERFGVNTTKTELLFLELFYKKLVVGGQAAIVVPSGVLFGSNKAFIQIKKILLENCQLEAIIYLPSGVFEPYAGVSTAILFFTKGGQTEKVWLYDLRNDGFSLTKKRTHIAKNDIPDLLKKFPSKKNSDNSLSITIDEIIENKYNLFVRRYIDNTEEEKEINIQEEINQSIKFEKEISNSLEKFKDGLRDLRFKV